MRFCCLWFNAVDGLNLKLRYFCIYEVTSDSDFKVSGHLFTQWLVPAWQSLKSCVVE